VVSSGCGLYTITLPATIDPWGNNYVGNTVNTTANDPDPVYSIRSNGCTTCAPAIAPATRYIWKNELNGQRAKAGLSPCS